MENKEKVVQESTNKIPAENRSRTEKGPYTGTNITKLGPAISDENDLVVAEMPGANQRAEIAKMERAIKEGSICYGKVVGVEVTNRNEVHIVVKRDTLRVVIPAEDFFAHSVMKDMDKESEEGKFIRYRRKASHMFGAAVSFIPKGMGYDDNGVPFVIASRKSSMDKLQERHFFGPNADVAVGSVAKASIVSVGPRYVTVECLGLEVVIGTGGLSAFAYIEDASQEYHTGDGLIVAVEKLDVDKENHKVTAELSHALVERLEAKVETVSDKMLNGRYMATIVAVLPNYYVAIITGLKIRGLIPVNGGYVGTDSLIVGDNVVMLVTGINEEKNLVIGRCMKSN